MSELLDVHLEQLRKSGLTDETIAACQIESVRGGVDDERRVAALLAWPRPPPVKKGALPLGSGLLFPYFGLDGSPMTVREPGGRVVPTWSFRPEVPREMEGKDGKKSKSKYLRTKQLKGDDGGTPAYIPPNARSLLLDAARTHLVIVEGEKKAACLAQLGFPAIAIAGVDNAHVKSLSDERGRWVLNPVIAQLARGCLVIVAFDADAHTNADVLAAAARLAAMVLDSGARGALLATPPALVDGKGPKGFDDLFFERGADAVDAAMRAAKPIDPAPIEKRRAPWGERVRRTEDGRVVGSIGNVATIVGEHERLAGRLGFDERSVRPVWLRTPPWSGTAREGLAVSDAHVVELAAWMNEHVDCAATTGVIADAVEAVARRAPFDPVRAYLEGLTWDGVSRVDRWLLDCCDIDRRDELERYVSVVGARWMIAAVARALEPGCKVDNVLTLEGAQGVEKSGTVRALVPDQRWFLDHLPQLHDKDAKLAIAGPWIVELAELDALRRSDIAAVKAFITTQVDKFRAPYGRSNVENPRRCIFAATINPDGAGWMTDPTGGRRFWPVQVRRCYPEKVAKVRDQLWAEAVVRFKRGERHWIDASDDVAATVEEEQSARYASDPWEQLVTEYVDGLPSGSDSVTTREVLEHLLCARDSLGGGTKDAVRDVARQATRGEEMRVGRALKRAGWERRQERTDGGSRRWVYVRPERQSEARKDEAEAFNVPGPGAVHA